jgi:hypothetical protein
LIEEAEWAIDAVAECLDDFVGESSSVRVAVNEFWWVTLYDLQCVPIRSIATRSGSQAGRKPRAGQRAELVADPGPAILSSCRTAQVDNRGTCAMPPVEQLITNEQLCGSTPGPVFYWKRFLDIKNFAAAAFTESRANTRKKVLMSGAIVRRRPSQLFDQRHVCFGGGDRN